MTETEYRVFKARQRLRRYYLDMMDIYDTIRVINLKYAISWWEENLLSIAQVLVEDCNYREKHEVTEWNREKN